MSFRVSVCLSIRMEQFDSHCTAFHENWYLNFFFYENLSRKFKFRYELTRITGILHEDRVCVHISLSTS
jgi:hypothetical protein